MRARNQSPAGLQGFSCWEIQFPKRRCVGAVEVLDDLGTGTKLFCPPEATNNLVRVRVIVAHVEARPQRLKDGLGSWQMKRWQKLGPVNEVPRRYSLWPGGSVHRGNTVTALEGEVADDGSFSQRPECSGIVHIRSSTADPGVFSRATRPAERSADNLLIRRVLLRLPIEYDLVSCWIVAGAESPRLS
jgi:hypothetical protein